MKFYKKENDWSAKYTLKGEHIHLVHENGRTERDGFACARKCDQCGGGMSEGFYDSGTYYCSENCLLHGNNEGIINSTEKYTMKDWEDDCVQYQGECYWTTWEEVDEDEFYDEDGNLYELIED